MATIVNMHDAKTNLSRLVERALAGEEIWIARAGKPLVKLSPARVPSTKRPIGSARGRFHIHDEFYEPLDDAMWDFSASPVARAPR